MEHGTIVTVYGAPTSPKCYELRDYLTRMHMEHHWHAIEEAEHCTVAVYRKGQSVVHLEDPSVNDLAIRLGFEVRPSKEHYEVVIVGGGPAGLSAAVYAASEGRTTLVLDKFAPGGQAGLSSRIENYLGFPQGIPGHELTASALQQAIRFGAEVASMQEVTNIEKHDSDWILTTDKGAQISAESVILSPGVDYRTLQIPGAERFIGRGVFYGAAETAAKAVEGGRVHVVGAGNSAGQAALYLAKFAVSTTMLVRGDNLEKSMSKYLVERIAVADNIHVKHQAEVTKVDGGETLSQITVKSSHGELAHNSDGLFVFVGARPRTDFATHLGICEPKGFVIAEGFTTAQPGIFACGDARLGSIKRVASAVGEGACAVSAVHQHMAHKE